MHDVFAFVIFTVVIGDILMALTHRDALRSMFQGWVSVGGVRKHAQNEMEEEWPKYDSADSHGVDGVAPPKAHC